MGKQTCPKAMEIPLLCLASRGGCADPNSPCFFAQLLVDIFDSISLIGQYYYVLQVITRPLDKRLLSSGSASLDAALLEVEARKAK